MSEILKSPIQSPLLRGFVTSRRCDASEIEDLGSNVTKGLRVAGGRRGKRGESHRRFHSASLWVFRCLPHPALGKRRKAASRRQSRWCYCWWGKAGGVRVNRRNRDNPAVLRASAKSMGRFKRFGTYGHSLWVAEPQAKLTYLTTDLTCWLILKLEKSGINIGARYH